MRVWSLSGGILRRMIAGFCIVAGLVCIAPSAEAAWYRAETDRFIVYGEGRQAWVREYAIRLTTFDAVLRSFNPGAAKAPLGHKVEVYLVSGSRGVRQVAPGQARTTAGFYAAGPDGIIAVANADLTDVGADAVLFHEYAHHFMSENFPAAYPAWFVEGWAEYFMTAEIGSKTVKVGGYSVNRAYWLFNSAWLPLEDLLTKSYREIPKDKRPVYYSQAWLLMHYMRSDDARGAQLDKAIQAIAKGAEPVKAFRDATGLEIGELTARLRRYDKLPAWSLPNPFPKPPPVQITAMPASADDVILARARLTISSVGERDDLFLADLRMRAGRHPGDKLADLTLAHAEFLMGDVAAGEAIVQRRMAADPGEVDALRIAGRGQVLAGERNPAERAARFKAARALFGKAYRLDQRDYRILFAYAYARTAEPGFPSDNDIEALTQAYLMAPSVRDIAMVSGLALMQKGRRDEAVWMLSRIANNPHGGPDAERARALIAGRSLAEANAAAEASAPEEAPQPPQPTGS